MPRGSREHPGSAHRSGSPDRAPAESGLRGALRAKHPGSRATTARPQRPHGGCAAECWSPCRPRYRPNRSPAGSGSGRAEPSALACDRRSCPGSRRSLLRCRAPSRARASPSWSRCSGARPPPCCRETRSCPDHRRAGSAATTAARDARGRRRSASHRAGGTDP